MFVLNPWLALASLLVVPIMLWFTQFVATLHPQGLPRSAEAAGRAERRDGRGHQRAEGGQSLPPQRAGDRALPPAQPGGLQAGVYANTYALLLMPLTNVLGNFFVIVLAGWAAGWRCRGW
jgi:ATP-binding cassette, subfamily B, multidrug efflux pump